MSIEAIIVEYVEQGQQALNEAPKRDHWYQLNQNQWFMRSTNKSYLDAVQKILLEKCNNDAAKVQDKTIFNDYDFKGAFILVASKDVLHSYTCSRCEMPEEHRAMVEAIAKKFLPKEQKPEKIFHPYSPHPFEKVSNFFPPAVLRPATTQPEKLASGTDSDGCSTETDASMDRDNNNSFS